jgi:hypothetical protein
MKETFTPLLTFNDLKAYSTDLFCDAYGFDIQLSAILPQGENVSDDPSDEVLAGLFERISHDAKVQ